ncbi:hypothetical protein [Deinococcus petrolearius]|uniref:Uncharacterized protein n=1 Tax=Deinococcus petrolearius TaxID=1751295 RepID=A0ABW1DL61_9DEIO
MLDGPVDLPIDAVTQLETSEAHAGLQLADVMSGLTTMLCAAIWTRQPLGEELTRTRGLILSEKYGGSGHFHAVAASTERQAPGDYRSYLAHLEQAMKDDPNFPVIPRQGRRPPQAGEAEGKAPTQDQAGPQGDP